MAEMYDFETDKLLFFLPAVRCKPSYIYTLVIRNNLYSRF